MDLTPENVSPTSICLFSSLPTVPHTCSVQILSTHKKSRNEEVYTKVRPRRRDRREPSNNPNQVGSRCLSPSISPPNGRVNLDSSRRHLPYLYTMFGIFSRFMWRLRTWTRRSHPIARYPTYGPHSASSRGSYFTRVRVLYTGPD